MEELNINTNAVALYGAIIATISMFFSIILGIKELRKDQQKLKIKSSLGRIILDNNLQSESLIIIEGQNRGFVPVCINGVGWLLNDGTKLQILNPYLLKLPYDVNPRKNLIFYFPSRWFNSLSENNKIVGFYFKNEQGKMWKMKIFEKMKVLWSQSKNDGFLIEWNKETNSYNYKQNDQKKPN